MYHVISTTFITLLLYLISYFFYRIGYITLQQHRKLWNTLLAIAFFITALAGVFLALQINYKWNIPFIKSILKWHVESGIGMAITGFIHFFWHLKYYGELFTKQIPDAREKTEPQLLSINNLRISLFVTGLVSTSIQFLLLREIMNITGGYELISGSFLGSWLIGSALGSYLAGKSKLNNLRRVCIVFLLSPLISLILLLFLSRIYLNPGETPSFLPSIIYTFIVLLPFCLASGFTFIKLLDSGKANGFLPGSSFSVETVGGIAAGLLTSFLASGFLNTYKFLLLITIVSAGSFFILFNFNKKKIKLFVISITCLAALAVLFSDPDLFARRLLQPAVAVIYTLDTPYGNITKGKYKGEESLYYNQKLLSYNKDVSEREEDIHYAMLQSESPRNIIMISGSLKSHLPELLKYPVKSIIYIERDPYLAGIESDSVTKNVQVLNADPYNYISRSGDSADVIILLTPPPSTLLLNRYYTLEFFSAVKKKLSSDGIFMCSPGPGDNYYNKESVNLYSSVYNSLAANFRNVKPVVGNKLYFLASDKSISLAFCELVQKRSIDNIYVCSDYLEDELILKKSAEVSSVIKSETKLNRSAFPVACLHSQAYQFSKNINEKTPSLLLMAVAFVLPVITLRRRHMIMYFSASALAGFEIIMLITLQITVGNMYQLTGLIIAGFMAGLAMGSGTKFSFLDTILLRNKVIFLMIFYLFFGMIYNNFIAPKSAIFSIIEIMCAGFLPAFLTGNIFRELTMKQEGTAVIYSADLAGSALGFVLISGFAVPVLGIRSGIFLLGILTLGGVISVWKGK